MIDKSDRDQFIMRLRAQSNELGWVKRNLIHAMAFIYSNGQINNTRRRPYYTYISPCGTKWELHTMYDNMCYLLYHGKQILEYVNITEMNSNEPKWYNGK